MNEIRNIVHELKEKSNQSSKPIVTGTQLNTPAKNTIIISAFPGCGKSEATAMHKTSGEIWLDSDSSKFHWIYNQDGSKLPNPQFPQNYLKHIQNFSGYADVIFVSTHKEILELLCDNNIPFVLVRPYRVIKDAYIRRYKERGNDDSFINLMNTKWDQFMDDMDKFSDSAIQCFELGRELFLSDVMDNIVDAWTDTVKLTTIPVWYKLRDTEPYATHIIKHIQGGL